MSIPPLDDYIPSMYDFAGTTIAGLVRESISPDNAIILDVGSGWGKYRWLLPEYEMDACEAWAPVVQQCRTSDYYRHVYVQDATTFEPQAPYDGIILGDMLEHIPAEAAAPFVERVIGYAKYVWVASPFLMPQEPTDGNPYEEHQQVDLDFSVMDARYPSLSLVASNSDPNGYVKAVYANRR